MSESGKAASPSSDEQSAPVSSAPVRRLRQGPILPIGGAEKKGTDEETAVLERFFDLAGGKRARIVVIPTASEEPQEAGERYIKAFGELGAPSIEVLDVKERADANADAAVEQVRNATGIFITGGAQARLVALLVGTRVMEEIRERNANGVVVAGTSAGASIVASHMMVGGTGNGGNSSDAAARKSMVELVAGFGLLQDVIIDQHFSQRGRMGRLISVFAANPGLLGVGLDEDTAVEIDRDGHLVVHGSGMVTIVDGRNTTSNYFDIEPGEVLTVTGSSLHVMGAGQRFDLNERRLVEPATSRSA